jgi:serine/alanine adding enzyme
LGGLHTVPTATNHARWFLELLNELQWNGNDTPVASSVNNGLEVSLACDEDGMQWNDYARNHIVGTLYHDFEWRRLIAKVHGHDCPYLMARRAGRVVGVLPLVQLKSPIFGNYLVSMPYLSAGGALASDDRAAAALMLAGADIGIERGCSHFESRDLSMAAVPWVPRTDKVLMQLELPDSVEGLGKQIGKKLRAQVKRPVREGAITQWGALDLLDDFYAVFSRNMRDLGTPVYAKAFFAAILESFPDAARLCVVRIAGKPVAAAFLIDDGERRDIPWASSLREYGQFSVNMMLYWEVLKDAVERGIRVFDFGRSSVDSGTYRFKRQWGAEPVPMYWHYWLADPEDAPGLTPDNPKYALAISVWQRLPVWLTQRLGPNLVKYLP